MPSLTATTHPPAPSATSVSARTLSLAMGGLSALVSGTLRPSWDETFWLGVARLVQRGRDLYDGAIDNKTPPVYLVTWLVDRAPGDFQLARAVVVGALITAFSVAAFRLVALGRFRTFVVVVATTTVVLATDFVLTTELFAVTALLWGIVAARRGRIVGSIAGGVLAASFDPRTVVLFAGIALAAPIAAERRRIAFGLLAAVALAATFVLIVPDFRYGLIEANLASRGLRGGLDLTEWGVAFAQTALPIVLLMFAVRSSVASPGSLAVAAGGLLIGASSLHGFPHYWTYLAIVPLMAVPARDHSARGVTTVALLIVVAALVPSLAETITITRAQQDLWATYTPVIQAVGPEERIIVWDIRPHVAAERADSNLLRSPTIHYLGWRTSRTASFLEELPGLIDNATLIVDSGGLEGVPQGVVAELQPARDILSSRLDEFPCVSRVGSILIRARAGCSR